MRESDTYQAILEEGRMEGRVEGQLKEAVRALLLVGTPRFGEPDAAVVRRIENEARLEQLEEWLRHVTQVESWTDLPNFGE